MTHPARPRLGIFGGTFDPVHFGHLAAAVAVRQTLHLERVLLVVAARPWQKGGAVEASGEDRFAMVAAAVAGCEGLEASRIELDREGPTYTVDTIETLVANAAPDRAGGGGAPGLVLIVGADVADDLESWHRASDVARLVEVAVVNRPGSAEPRMASHWRVTRVNVPQVDAASSEIRRLWSAGRPVDHLVPAEVINLMRSRGLYSGHQMPMSPGDPVQLGEPAHLGEPLHLGER